MPHLIVIEGHEGQRRQLEETLTALTREDRQVSGKFDADGTFLDWRALLERVGSRGLFSAREAVVAEGCEVLGAFPDGLAGSLEGPEADAVIVATFGGEAKKVFSKEVLALKKVRFLKAEASVPPWKRKDWLLKLAQEKGWRLAPDAALLLGESIESTEELRSELAKLALYADGREIALTDVRALSFDEGGRALLTFLDGVCAGNAPDVARALSRLSRDPLLPVLTALCNRLRPALYIASFPGNEAQAAAAAGANREYAMRMARGALRLFRAEAVKDFMLRAVRLSFAEKTSVAQGWPGFELIVWDLIHDPAELADLDTEQIRLRLFSKTEDLPEGMTRLPIRSLHINKSPIVIGNLKVLTPAVIERWHIDMETIARHTETARRLTPQLASRMDEVYQRPRPQGPAPDVDGDLYGGFIGNDDRRRLDDWRERLDATASQAAASPDADHSYIQIPSFEDPRLEEMSFRYRARQFPDMLSTEEKQRWVAHCHARLHQGAGNAMTLATFAHRLDELNQSLSPDDEHGQRLLEALYDYGEQLA